MLVDAKGNPISSRSDKFIEVATRKTAAGEFLFTIDRLPNPSLLLQDVGKTISIYERIARQIDVAAAIHDYRAGISSMDFTIASNIDNSERAAWLMDYTDSLDVEDIEEQSLAARDFGFASLEVTRWKIYKGKTVPAKIELKPCRWFGFDQTGNFRFYPKDNPSEGVIVDEVYPNKFIVPRHKATYQNPYGVALLDLAYWYAVGLNGNFEFMLRFLEEDGRDKWVVRHPRNATPDEISKALNMAYNLRDNGVAAIPEGNEFDKKDVQGRQSSSEAYTRADELMSAKIIKLWFGTDLLMQKQGKGGYSSSQSGVEIRGEALASGKRIVSYTFEEIFRICASLNNLPGSDDEIIQFKLYREEDVTYEDAQRDGIYIDKGLKPTKKFFLNRGYQEDEFELAEPKPSQQPGQGGIPIQTLRDAAKRAGGASIFSAEDGANLDGYISAYEALRERLAKKKS